MASGISSPVAPQTASIPNTIGVKLNQENYTEWKPLISTFLQSRSLLGYVDGTTPCPSADDFFYSNWCRTDEDIRSCLFGTLTESLLGEVHDLPSSRAVWDALRARYVLGSRPTTRNIRRALNCHKLGTQSMDEYLGYIELLADQLKFVPASPLSNDDLVNYALEGLPQEYGAFITSIDNERETNTFEELRSKLIHQENQLKDAAYREDHHHHTPDSMLENATAQQQQEIALGQQDEIDSLEASVSEYEVFLSFRGPDSRQSLVDVLYRDMTAVGICVFRDNDELQTGDKISKILPCINNSKICVPIFSERFAESAWCLREVERMVDLKKKIMPIFYKVTPDDVKLRTDLFKKVLQKHVTKFGEEQVKKWENALKQVGRIIGQEVRSTGLAEFSKSFVTELIIKFKVNRKSVTEFLVQRDDQEEALRKLIDGNVARLVIGVHGMGGVGKTTLAKVTFNRVSAGFDCGSFLENIQDSINAKGLESLQKQLLENLDPKLKGFPVSDPIKMLKEKFINRKVLIVLDDVNESEQVDTIVGALDHFGSRSRIIITTRDKRVFPEGAQAFELQEMNQNQALQLFSRHVFRKDSPPSDRKDLSDEVVHLTGKLPLALRIIGSRLRRCEDEKMWKDTIEKLKDTLDQGVEKKLRISFDALDSKEKQIFLDIACFFFDKEMSHAMYLWEDCRLFPVLGIEVLVSMSLLKITTKDEFWMHDLVRDLGRAIVREKYPDKPVKWSRVWSNIDALEVLKIKKGKEEVKGLTLGNFPIIWTFIKTSDVNLTSDELSSFDNLRFLTLKATSLVGDFKHILLPQLRWFSWHGCLSLPEPTNLYAEKLVVLDLSESLINESWTGWSLIQRATNLKVLDLRFCFGLEHTPDLSNNKALEILIFFGCHNLIDMHSSIGELRRLKHLDLGGCRSLRNTPDLSNNEALERLDLSGCSSLVEIHSYIGKLKRLKHLNVKGCYSLKGFLEEIVSLGNLEEILVQGDGKSTFHVPESIGNLHLLSAIQLCEVIITGIPQSIGKLVNLTLLDLEGCKGMEVLPDTIGNLKSLVQLNLSGTKLSALPNTFGQLAQLEALYLQSTEITELPDTVGVMKALQILNLSGSRLRVLPNFVGHLKALRELNLSQTEVSVLPDCIGQLDELEELHLDGTRIKELPVTFRLLTSLTHLSLHSTDIEELPDSLGALTSLEYLDVSSSKLSKLPRSIGKLTKLESLYASGCNSLTEIPPEIFGVQSRLTSLKLTASHAAKVPPTINHLTSLQSLRINCHSNEVHGSSLTASLDLGALTLLRELELDCFGFKGIRQLPPALRDLTLIRVAPETELPDFSNLRNLSTMEFRDCSRKDAHELESLPESRYSPCVRVINCTEELGEFCRQLRNVKGLYKERIKSGHRRSSSGEYFVSLS